MDEASALIAVAEIAAALAGFSGVATALAKRDDAAFWSPAQRARFLDLLMHSGIGLFASLVPLVFLYRIGVTDRLWVLSSLVWAFCGAFGIAGGFRRQIRSRPDSRFERGVGIGVLIGFAGLLVLQIVNVIAIRAFWPYLGALVGNLAFAFVQFMRLVVPRPPGAQAEPAGSAISALSAEGRLGSHPSPSASGSRAPSGSP